jgi:hypothetical protein
MKIIREAKRHTSVSYSLFFNYVNDPGLGFSFACDENGVVDVSQLTPAGASNLRQCQAGMTERGPVSAGCVQRYVTNWKEPKVGRCVCGEEVELEGFTNTCFRCERDYNWNGQQLAPRECWGSETNETAADIMCGGDPFEGNNY